MAKQKVYTKKCADGTACSGGFGSPAFVADNETLCNACLLNRYGVFGSSVPNVALDPYSMNNYYEEDTVVSALRMATGL